MSAKRSLIPATVVAAALWGGASLAAGTQDLSHTYDLDKINQALGTAVSRLSLADSPITNVSVQLDESRTDLANEKMGINASFDLSQVSFQKGPVAVKGKADIKVLPESKEMPKGGFNLKLKAHLQADSVAFMKFVMAEAKHCEKAEKKTGVDRLVADSHCELSKRIATAENLDQMKEAFVAMRSETVSSLSAFVTAATGELAAVQNDIVRQEMSARVKRAHKLLKAAEESKITETENGFSVEVGKVSLLPGIANLDKAEMAFTPDTVYMAKAVTIKAGYELYEAAKPEIKKLLKGLEEQDACAISLVTSKMNIRVNLLSDMLD